MLVERFPEQVATWLEQSESFGRALDWLQYRTEAHVVGGTVRDLIMDRSVSDLDVIVPDGGIRLGRALAAELGAAFYVLDRERDVSRVVLDSSLHIDIARYREETLEGDLGKRDFTMNALAWKIGSTHPRVIDLSTGLADIQSRLVKVVTDNSLVDDPLRILRALRFESVLGLEIEEHTLELIHRDARLLANISAERLRDEFLLLLVAPNPIPGISRCVALGLSEPVLGFEDSELDRGVALLRLMLTGPTDSAAASPLIESFVRDSHKVLSADRPRWLLNRLAVLLWGSVTDSECGTTCERLVLSSKEQRHIGRVVCGLQWLRTDSSEGWWHSPESIFKYYDVLGFSGVDAAAILPSLSPTPAAYDAQRVLLSAWYECYESLVRPPRLVSGDRVSEITGAVGREIGRLLESLTLAQARGEISTAEQAEDWLSSL